MRLGVAKMRLGFSKTGSVQHVVVVVLKDHDSKQHDFKTTTT
jgi:hypothetical protein